MVGGTLTDVQQRTMVRAAVHIWFKKKNGCADTPNSEDCRRSQEREHIHGHFKVQGVVLATMVAGTLGVGPSYR